MRSTRWLAALLLAPAVACAPAAVALAAPDALASTAKSCTTSAPNGTCGPYAYGQISNSNGYNTYVTQDCWADPSCRQTLTSRNPGSWSVTSSEPANNTGVRTYPNVQQLFSDWCGSGWNTCSAAADTPISVLWRLRSRFAENMHTTHGTIAEAGYDIWLSGTSGSREIMIWVDNARRGTGGAAVIGHTTIFGQRFTILQYGGAGGEIIFSLNHNEHTGTAHILTALRWLQAHKYVPAHAKVNQVDFGWEICSTGGDRQAFSVSAYTLRAKCSPHVCG